MVAGLLTLFLAVPQQRCRALPHQQHVDL